MSAPALSRTTKISLIASVALLAVAALVFFLLANTRAAERTDASEGAQAIRESSHRLDVGPAGSPELVEFLDFECESCAAAYPFVEELRAEFEGELTFAIRYFPIPSHQNSTNAALAVEAAAQQGQLEAMYRMMYDTQPQWGEQTVSQAPLFRSFAEILELDLEKFDATVAAESTAARVKLDFDEGLALGVQGTPTFFLDGELVNVASTDEFRALVDEAVSR